MASYYVIVSWRVFETFAKVSCCDQNRNRKDKRLPKVCEHCAITNNFWKFQWLFVNVGPTLAKGIPKINKSPLEHMGNGVAESIYLNPVTHEEIKQIIFSL